MSGGVIVLVWTGLGILVPIIWFACYLVVALIVGFFGRDYWDAHSWPKLVGCWAAAVPIGWIGYILNDPRRSGPYQRRGGHTFFLVPMEWWSAVLVVTGGVLFFVAEKERPQPLPLEQTELEKKLEESTRKANAAIKYLELHPESERRMLVVGDAYLKAEKERGRPPKNSAELEFHLKDKQDLVSAVSEKPFGVAWGTSAHPTEKSNRMKTMLVWEAEPSPAKTRTILFIDQAGSIILEDVGDVEFQGLHRKINARDN